MKNQSFTQEGLKLIACITMLIDHIGSAFVPVTMLRCVGRLSFPIFAFLIAEGSYHTKNPKKYALRMLFLAVLSEYPFELAFFGGYTPYRQNVMLTLLMGILALEVMKKCPNLLLKALSVIPFALVAEWMKADYGMEGVLVIALFALTRGMRYERLIQFVCMLVIFASMNSSWIPFGPIQFRMQILGAFAILPICFYSGEKQTHSKAVQWAFNLFYPAHLLLFGLIQMA